jgi:hypothetical protein
LRVGGYLAIYSPDSPIQESDTFTCVHCQQVVLVRPKASASECGGWCGRCAKPICPKCAAKSGCTPFEKKLERAESRARMLKAISG